MRYNQCGTNYNSDIDILKGYLLLNDIQNTTKQTKSKTAIFAYIIYV